MTDEKKNVGVPAGAQTDAAAGDANSVPEVDASDVNLERMSEEAAWKAFPKQVQAALTYAKENKYDYGPSLRKIDLEYTVVSARAMSDQITRVVLEYRPAGGFKGQSGSEYLDLDSSGVVQARRQISVPKEVKPWFLIGAAVVSVIAAPIIIAIIFMTGEATDTTFVAGRTLWVQSEQPRIGQYVTYDSLDAEGIPRTWIVIPEGEGTSIAFVELTVINWTSGVVNLAIDSEAAELILDSGVIVRPIDVLSRVLWPEEGSELSPRLSVDALPLWGDRTLEEGQQLSGFMAFEVPTGSKVDALRWAATDVANIRY